VIERREKWRAWVTPKPLRSAPIHRWYAFPHSFTGELVGALIDEWGLDSGDHLADPFVGAGTTVLAARQKVVPATGYDLSPFAVFITRVKLQQYDARRAAELWGQLHSAIRSIKRVETNGHFPTLVKKALPSGLLGTFVSIDNAIDALPTTQKYKNLFRLALLAVIPRFSRAVATGGWLKWIGNRTRGTGVRTAMALRVQQMLQDIEATEKSRVSACGAIEADARRLPADDQQFSAIITSPPYPNRHDYTRVFGVELMFGFLNWEQTRDLRYQSIHSHPEGRPHRPNYDDYQAPRKLTNALVRMRRANLDPKILEMLAGYFIDMHLCLKECQRVVASGGRIAFVVGNAQYRGVPLKVDELIGEIGTALGLEAEKIIAVRLRGNSAQQMGEFGRKPSRESVVIFRRPKRKK
jgi:tRNA G10  N-methylase Trm11